MQQFGKVVDSNLSDPSYDLFVIVLDRQISTHRNSSKCRLILSIAFFLQITH